MVAISKRCLRSDGTWPLGGPIHPLMENKCDKDRVAETSPSQQEEYKDGPLPGFKFIALLTNPSHIVPCENLPSRRCFLTCFSLWIPR